MSKTEPSCPICQVGHDKEHQKVLDEKMRVFEAELDPKRKKELEKRIKDLKAKSTSLILVGGRRGKMSWQCPVRIKMKVNGKEDPREHYEAPHFTMTK